MPKAREPVVDRSGLAISVGTCVLVKPDAGSLLYVAEVQKILKQGRLSVNWFYRPEEVLGGRKSFHGRQELFRSNHQDEVHVDTVECRCFVHSLDDYLALKNPAETDFFVRLEYDPAEKRFYPDEVPIYCTCSLPYNPDKFMVQCSICEEWYHPECLAVTIGPDTTDWRCPQCKP